ncbi:MAG: UMP kinase [Candidatus Methanomethylicaceae archaeon]
MTIKLSGHVLFSSLSALPDLKAYANVIKEIKSLGHLPHVVVGGGEPARYYIRLAREQGADESTCDQVGITIANLNAKIFIRTLGDDACQFVPRDFEELNYAISTGKIIVMGGLQPGQSTNAVSCVLAERTNSKLFINTTTVDGVYTSDPKKDPTARKYDTIRVEELTKVLGFQGIKAGEYDLIDPVALKIIQRSKITTKIIDGRDPKNILRAIMGEKIGTTILP